jgi:hypothetical protein
MSRILKISAIAVFALALMVPAASAQRFGGGFRYGGGFRGGFGGPFIGFGYYGPGWFYGPGYYWGPYGYGYYGSAEGGAYGTGHVKLDMQAKDALVYVDGGYAGLSGKLKNFPLKSGSHTLELRDPGGHTFYQERINVLPGRTIDIHGDSPNPSPGPSPAPNK